MGTKVIPGMESLNIEAIDITMDRYVDIRDRRMELTKQEVAAKDALTKAMNENNQTKYIHSEGHSTCIIEEGETKTKVKKIDDDGEGGSED